MLLPDTHREAAVCERVRTAIGDIRLLEGEGNSGEISLGWRSIGSSDPRSRA
jgi:hypothetical protein